MTFIILLFKAVERLGTQRKSNQNAIEKFKPIETNKPITAKFSLNPVKVWSKNLPNFVYPILMLQNRSHTAVLIYFLNYLPLSQHWIEIHFEVLSFLLSWIFIILFMAVEGLGTL